MQKNKLALYICENYKKEIEAVLHTLPQYLVEVHYLGNKGSCFPVKEGECNSIVENLPGFEKTLVIGGVCLSPLKKIQSSSLELIILDNCFSIFCPIEIINGFMEDGAYIVTPHWLQSWEDHLEKWGLNESNRDLIFNDELKKIVLIDTGVYSDSQEKLTEFASYVSLPSLVYTTGTGYFKLFIAGHLEKLIQKTAFENQKDKFNELQRSYSELQISNDMLLQLTKETDEVAVINKIMELFKMITAAETLVYIPIPVKNDFYYSFPGSTDFSIKHIQKEIKVIDKTMHLNESGSGFYLRFQSASRILGYMLIDQIPMADFLDHYFNIATSIVDICALMIGNTQNFTKIRDQNKQQMLLNQVLEMLFYSNDETDEIRKILEYLKDYTDVEAIAIRLENDDGYPYYDSMGMSRDFLEKENNIKEYSNCSGLAKELQCFCGSVISGRVKKDLSCFTENGSFWIGDSVAVDKIHVDELKFNVRGTCITEGYNTIVLIPLISNDKNLGLIQFNDKRLNLLSLEDVLFLEKVCNSIGIALNKKKLREDLEKSRLMAESANKAKSEFLANMSHEIRTPLNAIMGFSDLIKNLSLTDKQQKYFNSINSAGQSLLTLINDILDLSKIEAGMLELKYEYFDLRDLFNEIQLIFQLKLTEKDLNFVIDIDSNLPDSLFLDEVRIRQILLNLIGNAIKFTDRGFIRITVSILSSDEEGETLDLSVNVEDSGIGIPEDELELIFQEFRQQSSHDNRIYGGTGLGLSIVKRLIDKMEGYLSVKSTVGQGSSFKVNLFRVKIGKKTVPKEVDDGVNLKNFKFDLQRILIVDDIQSNREMLNELLNSVNLKTAEAVDGKEGILIACEFRPELILLDIRMPVMDGYEMIAELKKNELLKHIPVIAMTASVYNDFHFLSAEYGFYSYILKPIDINKLLKQIYFLFNKDEKVNKSTVQSEEIEGIEERIKQNIDNLPDGFISAIKEDFIKRIDSLKGAVIIRDVKQFGLDFSNLCREYNVTDFDGFAEEIIDASELFDVDQINRLFVYFKSVMGKKERI